MREDPISVKYVDAVENSAFVQGLLTGTVRPEWTVAKVLHDDSGKTLSTDERRELLLLPQLWSSFGRPSKSLDMVSPYFVPAEQGTKNLSELAKSDVRVRALTNSLAATDEKSVHIGYAKHSKELLSAGVQLLELKSDAMAILQRAGEVASASER